MEAEGNAVTTCHKHCWEGRRAVMTGDSYRVLCACVRGGRLCVAQDAGWKRRKCSLWVYSRLPEWLRCPRCAAGASRHAKTFERVRQSCQNSLGVPQCRYRPAVSSMEDLSAVYEVPYSISTGPSQFWDVEEGLRVG